MLGVLGLLAGYRYFGDIIRGADADYPYALAHSIVFDRDPDITNNMQMGDNPIYLDPSGDRSFARVPRRPDGGFRNKWPMGLSLVEAPAIAVAHLIRLAVESAGAQVDGPAGYSTLEVLLAGSGLVIVIAAGLALAFHMAARHVGAWPAAVGVAGCWLGTSLFYYTSVQPFWAHGVSFACLVAVMWVSRPLWQDGSVNQALVSLGAVLGLTCLVRPQQALVGFFLLPALLRVVWMKRPRHWLPGAVAGLALCAAALAVQALMNYSQFGVFTLNAYRASGERFVIPFSVPQGDLPYVDRLQVVLFDRERGLLVFSPVVALAAAGFLGFWRRIPDYVWPAIGNAVAQVFVIAAWHPRQGEAFGSRMWTDASVVVVFGVGLLLANLAPRGRRVAAVAVAAAIGWTCYMLARGIGVL